MRSTISKSLFLLTALAFLPLASRAQEVTQWQDSLRLSLSCALSQGQEVGRQYAVRVTPMLVSDRGDTLRFQPVVFRGKRNARLMERGRLYGTELPADCKEVAAGELVACHWEVTRQQAPWAWQRPTRLEIARQREGCCDIIPMAADTLQTLVYVPPFVPRLPLVADNAGKAGELVSDNPVLLHVSHYRPYDPTRVLRKEKGALYVHFPVGKSRLREDFRGNDSTLRRIVDITRAVMADSVSTVKLIQIVGLASVEGPRPLNQRLAGQRAEALKRYVQERVDVPDSLFECVNGGEAWTELRDQVADGDFPGREELLRIIDSEPDADKRERLMRQSRGGDTYAYLRDNVLADQRNSGYVRVYYDYVPDTVAAVINRAAQLLRQGDHAQALRLLRGVAHDQRAWNALGVALYREGQEQEAMRYLRQAANQGDTAAQANLRQIEERARALTPNT